MREIHVDVRRKPPFIPSPKTGLLFIATLLPPIAFEFCHPKASISVWYVLAKRPVWPESPAKGVSEKCV